MAGSFTLINEYLVADLAKLGLWNPSMKNAIVAAGGSVQSIAAIPEDIKALYKTVWEIKQRAIIDMAADRGARCFFFFSFALLLTFGVRCLY